MCCVCIQGSYKSSLCCLSVLPTCIVLHVYFTVLWVNKWMKSPKVKTESQRRRMESCEIYELAVPTCPHFRLHEIHNWTVSLRTVGFDNIIFYMARPLLSISFWQQKRETLSFCRKAGKARAYTRGRVGRQVRWHGAGVYNRPKCND